MPVTITTELTGLPDHGRTVKAITECKPEGSRKMRRPRLRRMEDVQKDLWEMKVKIW